MQPIIIHEAPVCSQSAAAHLKQFQICQNKYLKIIVNKPFYFYSLVNLKLVKLLVLKVTRNFQGKLRNANDPLVESLITNS